MSTKTNNNIKHSSIVKWVHTGDQWWIVQQYVIGENIIKIMSIPDKDSRVVYRIRPIKELTLFYPIVDNTLPFSASNLLV